MNPETKNMWYPTPARHKNLWTTPCRKSKVDSRIKHILHLPSGQRIITYSGDGSFRVWDLERGTQVGKEWEDKERGVSAIALSPGSKTVATGSEDGAVRLRNVDTGKVIKKWTGHAKQVQSVCWSPDGGRVVSGSFDETFRVWDVKTGETNLGPIKAGELIYAVCYSPDSKMIAVGGDIVLKIWDANSGELLKTLDGGVWCLAWTLDGKTLVAGESKITKFNTATWAVLDVRDNYANTTSLSPNEPILASTSLWDNTVRLWNLETNKSIGTPLHHECRDRVNSATFSADGKFLVTSCRNGHIYTWDVSAIIKQAGLLSDIADATPKPAPKMKGARQVPPGFFDDALREANLRTRVSQSHAPNSHPTPTPHQHALGRFSSFWRRSKPHGTTERDTQSRFRPLSWTRNLVSGILHRRDGSDIELREVEVPYAAGKPRNYHARKKPADSSSRPSDTHAMQQHSAATQSTPSSSQKPPPITTTSTFSAVPGIAEATGTTSRPRITIDSGWRTHFMHWVCCMPVQRVDDL